MQKTWKKVSAWIGLLASLMLTCSAWAQEAVEAVATGPKIDSGDTTWILVSTALVLLMTPGLAFFYAGMVRSKNVVSTLFQNFAALPIVGLLWAVIGYSLVFGKSNSGIIGGFDFLFLKNVGQEPNPDFAATIPHAAFMLFQCMFAVITPVLITGAIAERVKFKPFLMFMVLWSLLVYAPVAHWVWGVGGWIRNDGGLDFAGGLVVHMTAAFSGLLLSILLKKRKDFGTATQPHDISMVLLGTALLWFGWFGFNGGSALASGGIAVQAFGTTFFASAAAGLAWFLYDNFKRGKPSLMGACVGVVAGLVTITPAAGFVSFSSAIVIGLLAGVICNFACGYVKEKLGVDDTLDVFGCHGVGGTLGAILTAVFASKAVNPAGADGLIYGSSSLLVSNLIGCAAVIAISLVGTFICFKIVNAISELRPEEHEEHSGLDHSEHGEVISSSSFNKH